MSLKKKIKQQLRKENQNHLVFDDIATQLGFSHSSTDIPKNKSMFVFRWAGCVICMMILFLIIGICIQKGSKKDEWNLKNNPSEETLPTPPKEKNQYIQYYQDKLIELEQKILGNESDHSVDEAVNQLGKVQAYLYKEKALLQKELIKCQNDETYTMPIDLYEAYMIGNYSNQLTEYELFDLAETVEEIPITYHKKIELDENTWLYLYQLEVLTQNKKRSQYYVKIIGKSLDQVSLCFQLGKEQVEMSELVSNQLEIIPFQSEYAMTEIEILWYRGVEEKENYSS